MSLPNLKLTLAEPNYGNSTVYVNPFYIRYFGASEAGSTVNIGGGNLEVVELPSMIITRMRELGYDIE